LGLNGETGSDVMKRERFADHIAGQFDRSVLLRPAARMRSPERASDLAATFWDADVPPGWFLFN
jgi:hypothetical protein